MSCNTIPLSEAVESANTGLDAIRRAPITDEETGIKCLRIQDISQFKDYKSWGNSKVKSVDFEKFQLQKNDLIIARTGTIGVNLIIKDKLNSVFNNGLIRLRAKKNYLPTYLYYQMQSKRYRSYIDSIAHGTSVQPNMKIRDLLRFKIEDHNLDNQKKIVTVLESLDNKINTNQTINKYLDLIGQAIFKSWFIDFDPVYAKKFALESGLSAEQSERGAMAIISGICSPIEFTENFDEMNEKLTQKLSKMNKENQEKLAWTASLFPNDFEESELGEIPKGWKVSTVDHEFEITMGQSPKSESYNENGEGCLFFQGSAEFGWRFPKPRLYTTEPRRLAEKGNVLMSVRAPVGDLNISPEDCCIGRGLATLLHKSASISYTYYFLKHLQSNLDSYNTEGTVFGSINQKNLKAIEIISPSDELVSCFVSKISVFDKEIETLELQSQSLAQLRDSLLPKLLAGEINLDNIKLEV